MISGWLLWNAVAVCEMTKTSWQTGNLTMNEDWENPSRTCFVLGCEFWEEDILIAAIGEFEKLDASETYPRRLNAKEVLITKKDLEFVFLVADGSATLLRRDYEFQEQNETGIHRKERESQRRISRREGRVST